MPDYSKIASQVPLALAWLFLWIFLALGLQADASATPTSDIVKAGVESSPSVTVVPSTDDEDFYRLCPKCGAPNFPAAEYCAQCGSALLPETEEGFYQFCPECGAPNFPAAKYCAQCGAALTPATQRLSGLKKYAAAVGATGTPYYAGGGVFARLDWDNFAWGGEYVFVGPCAADDGFRQVTAHYLENSIRVCFQKRPFRPFFTLELRFRYEYALNDYYWYGPDVSHRYVIVPTIGGGLNISYGVHPSYVEFGGTLGWADDKSTVDKLPGSITLNFASENVTYFWPRLGVLARASATVPGVRHDDGPFLLVSVGPVLDW